MAVREMKETAMRRGTKRARRGRLAWATLILAAVLALALATTGLAASARTELISVSSSGEQGNGDSAPSAISADGRDVAFSSDGSNLVAGDTNRTEDVFVRDRELGTTERVSVSSTGQQGNDESFEPAISANGRYVAFTSGASNLVAGDTNGNWDVFVHDRKLGTTKRVSVSSTGREGNGRSWQPAISADGRYVAFISRAKNLVPRDPKWYDVFVRDRKRDTTRRVSVSSRERPGNRRSEEPAISANGRYVAFTSQAMNLVPGGRTRHFKPDVFVRDRRLGTTRRVSVSSRGRAGNGASFEPAISADGRYLAFTSFASNLVPRDPKWGDVFVRDRRRHTTRRVSVSSTGQQGNDESYQPAISADGRYVAFGSLASTLVSGDTKETEDVFVRDRKRDTTRRVSVSSTGQPGNSYSWRPAISADGRYVTFQSNASNLVPGDTNSAADAFVRGPLP
jgi:Tol biopolymer transport system component